MTQNTARAPKPRVEGSEEAVPLQITPAPSPAARAGRPWLWTAVASAIIAGGAALAVAWVFLVPIYQAPDEIVLIDYVFATYHEGHVITYRDGRDSGPPSTADPWTQYLATATGGEWIAFRPKLKAPPGYGGPGYFQSIDQNALPEPAQEARIPYLVTRYPFLYYVLEALWLVPSGLIAGAGPVELFFAARLFNVALLAISLACVYGIARELGLTRRRSLALLAATAIFPMVTFVSAYTQPDNLGFTLVSLSLLIGLKLRGPLRSRPGRRAWWLAAGLGVVLGMLLVTKYQYFLAAAVAVLGMLGTRLLVAREPGLARAWAAPAAVVALPVAAFFAIQEWVTWGSRNPLVWHTHVPAGWWSDVAMREAYHRGLGSLAAYVATRTWDAITNFWIGGQTFTGFWGRFGWEDAPLVYGTGSSDQVVRVAIQIVTLAVLALFLLRLEQVVMYLVRMARRGRWRWAAAIAFSNPATTSVLVFAAFMIVFFVYTDNTFAAQGRNWLPFVPWLFLATVEVAPRALQHAADRRFLGNVLLVSLVAVSAFGSLFAIGTLNERYYGAAHRVPAFDLATATAAGQPDGIAYKLEGVNGSDETNATQRPASDSRQGPITVLVVVGWAADTSAHGGVRAVFVTVDGRADYQARYGDLRDDVAGQLGGSSYRRTGFDLVQPIPGLAPGPHTVTLKIVAADGRTYWQPSEAQTFEVLPAA